MANLRPVLLISLVFLAYLLWVEWQKDYAPRALPGAAERVVSTETDLLPPSALPVRETMDDSGDAPGDLPTQQDEQQETASQHPESSGQSFTDLRRGADDERRPEGAGDREVAQKLPEVGVQHPRREVGRKPRARQESADQDHPGAAAAQPFGALIDRLARDPPAQWRSSERRSAERSPQPEQQEVAHQNAHEAGDDGGE